MYVRMYICHIGIYFIHCQFATIFIVQLSYSCEYDHQMTIIMWSFSILIIISHHHLYSYYTSFICVFTLFDPNRIGIIKGFFKLKAFLNLKCDFVFYEFKRQNWVQEINKGTRFFDTVYVFYVSVCC